MTTTRFPPAEVAAPSALHVNPVSGALGLEISGIDLRQPLDETVSTYLNAALATHGVLFFPGQHLTGDQHVAFASVFGTAVAPANPGADAPRDEVLVLSNAEANWHADITWMVAPPGAETFRVVSLPPVGGDTIWASTEAAYNSLSAPLQAAIDELEAVHTQDLMVYFGPYANEVYQRLQKTGRAPHVHPVVRVNPHTGAKSIFVNPGYTQRIVGLSEIESRHLLAMLFEHVKRPEHQVRRRWDVGDVVVWDNQATWHHAVFDYGGVGRQVQRVSTLGEVPFGPRAAGTYFRGGES